MTVAPRQWYLPVPCDPGSQRLQGPVEHGLFLVVEDLEGQAALLEDRRGLASRSACLMLSTAHDGQRDDQTRQGRNDPQRDTVGLLAGRLDRHVARVR